MQRPTDNDLLRRSDIRRRFDRAACDFERHDFVHRRAMDGLLERMQPMRLAPDCILDLGAGTGASSRQLAQLFGRRQLISLDLSAGMLRLARRARSRFSRIREVQADAGRLPFAAGSFDLVVANLLLPWIGDPAVLFGEVARVLRRGGAFAFSSLGPDSLLPLRAAWAEVDTGPHVHPFADMHDVGDALLRARLSDPVMDVDRLTVCYRKPADLLRDLTATGGRNCLADRRPGLTGKARFRAAMDALERRFEGDGLAVELELVFGHAWGSGPAAMPGEFLLDPGSIGRLARKP
ncbi:MAG: methyltransferase domain-containing protein [Gammaproteobacteria bacterium]|nr:methyltransferase domain-containing protein [Gammaproteobacteria bacterium]